jgi:hypothetical protein
MRGKSGVPVRRNRRFPTHDHGGRTRGSILAGIHSPAWWRRHWQKTGQVTVDLADWLPGGWHDWLRWNDVCDRDRGVAGEDAAMLREDGGRLLGFTRVAAHRT